MGLAIGVTTIMIEAALGAMPSNWQGMVTPRAALVLALYDKPEVREAMRYRPGEKGTKERKIAFSQSYLIR